MLRNISKDAATMSDFDDDEHDGLDFFAKAKQITGQDDAGKNALYTQRLRLNKFLRSAESVAAAMRICGSSRAA